MDAAPGIKVTFHRAFDRLRDPLAAIDAVGGVAASIGFSRAAATARRRSDVNACARIEAGGRAWL